MLDKKTVENILSVIPGTRFLVVGDVFLDKYLEIDSKLTEPSIETGLDAYQVDSVRCSPGAAGTVINNLSSLGAQEIKLLSVIGEDGEGFELKRELADRGVDCGDLIESHRLRTPTYIKPMHREEGVLRELNRLDVKNRSRLPGRLVREISHRLDVAVEWADAVLVSDQVSEPNCGVVGLAVRSRLCELGQRHSDKTFLVDSRENIGFFRHCCLKPNQTECLNAGGKAPDSDRSVLIETVKQLAEVSNRPVFCTIGDEGSLVSSGELCEHVPTSPVSGPIDIVGAGDSACAAIACAVIAKVQPSQAAAFGNLIASITIQQIGTTGSATPAQVMHQLSI